jgi:hypothetical protein
MSSHPEVRRHLRRRDVLVLGAAGALVPWFGGIAQAAQAAQSLTEASVEPMSVGYVEGSGELARLDRVFLDARTGVTRVDGRPLSVVSATGLDLGDQELASTDLRVKVHGLYPSAPAACRGVDAIDLDVLFPSPEPADPRPLPFQAWSFRRRPGIDVSAPVSFRVPLEIDGGLTLSLRVAYRGEGVDIGRRILQGSPMIHRTYQTRFAVDWQAGRPKLQRGIYLLGARPAVWEGSVELPHLADRRVADLCSVVVSVEPIAPE